MTTITETIGGHTYIVETDDQGKQLSMRAADPPSPPPPRRILTKLEYRNLFTLAERVAIDNFAANPLLTPQQIQTLTSVNKDFSYADIINLDNQFAIQGTQLLEQYGLIAVGRAAQILASSL